MNMENTETKKIVGGGYASPKMNEMKVRFEDGFCRSGLTDDLTEEDGKFDWIQ